MIRRTTRRSPARLVARAALPVAFGLAAVGLAAACAKKVEPIPMQTAPVTRRNISVETQSTGVVEPINLIEVKSKASGLITRMPVDVGSVVKPGDLIAQIDTRDVRNQYDQSLAASRAAEAKQQVSAIQKKRADELFAAKVITAPEHETALIDFANAQSSLVAARTNLDLAKQRLEDATVRAPVAGVILQKTVSQGTVITSATSAFGGGTTIVQMADLQQVRMRALVNETDIGGVRLGQSASVVMDAYPNRQFLGTVEKVEPQAVVQQNVTMFPVLVSLDNSDRQLMPGMNGEVHMVAEQRDHVLSVPVDAIRGVREAPTIAPLLGLDPDSVRQQLASQMQAGRGGASRPGGDTSVRTGVPVDSATGRRRGNGAGDSARGGRHRQGDSTAPRTGGSDSVFAPGGAGASGGGVRSARGSAQFVFVKQGTSFVPRLIHAGVNNFEYVEVRSGLQEGEEVALLAAAALQQRREQQNERFRGMAGGPLGSSGGNTRARAR